MIQLQTEYTHINRAVILTGILQVEITSWTTTTAAIIYTIEDFIIDGKNAKHQINIRQKRVEKQQLDELDVAIMSSNDFAGLSDFERSWAKAKIGLFLFIQSDLLDDGIHTIYGKLPGDWELTPQV